MNRIERPPEVESAGPPAEPAGDTDRPDRLPLHIRIERRPPLPMGVRVAIFILGWLLILVGVAGLILPGIQGIATILVGAALLSLDNELVYKGLRKALQRWPGVWRKIEHFREKAHDKIHGWLHRGK